MKVAFEWDGGNDVKSYTKHGVSRQEAESVFQDDRKLHFSDPFHSKGERRYITVGRSAHPRILFIAWTLRGTKVRIISARPASRKERKVYEEKNKGKKRA
ncbi:MAG TPA: BrnT family toxin [bacterium]|nr:BrnT family toxin [bacterium]